MKEKMYETTKPKEQLIPVPELIIFDMDGTLILNPDFYRLIYSGRLNEVIEQERGQYGLDVLSYYRKNFEGRGEYALFALRIPFKKWADKLIAAPLDLISPQPEVVQKIRSLNTRKVVFTGSPTALAIRMFSRFGFDPSYDFDQIFGWKEPETFPLKWACSPFVFDSIARQFTCSPIQTMSVGDTWESDLEPAQRIGMKTVQIRTNTGNPDFRFANVSELILAMKGGE